MQRKLQSGGSKSLTLTPAEGREDVFEADSSGETECGTFGPQEPAPTDQRYSIKLNAPQDIGGRQTATRIEAYLAEETDEERKSEIDRRFYEDMKDHCATRSAFLQASCYGWARRFYAGVVAFG